MESKYYKNIILGAGISGLAAGIEFNKADQNCIILEKEKVPGGLCQSIKVGECEFDFGPKILLLDDSENSNTILSYLDGNYLQYPISEGTYLSEYGLLGFPLQRYLYCLPEVEKKKVLDDIEKARKSPKEINNYKSWLINAFGEYFCKKVLFPYEEKKWQIKLDKLDYKWALNRPIRVDYDEIKLGAISKLPPKGNYYYPKIGSITTLVDGMVKHSCPIEYNQEVVSINTKEKYVETKNYRYYYENLVSTIPINIFLNLIEDKSQNFQNSDKFLHGLGILVVNLVFKENYDLQGSAIYFPEKKYIFRRVSVLQNLCPALSRDGYTPLQVEVSIKGKIDTKEYTDRILKDLKSIKQFSVLGKPELINCLNIDFAYPLPSTGLEEYIKNIHTFYEKMKIYHCGRGGNYVYCNLDKAYKQGSDLAKIIIGDKK